MTLLILWLVVLGGAALWGGIGWWSAHIWRRRLDDELKRHTESRREHWRAQVRAAGGGVVTLALQGDSLTQAACALYVFGCPCGYSLRHRASQAAAWWERLWKSPLAGRKLAKRIAADLRGRAPKAARS